MSMHTSPPARRMNDYPWMFAGRKRELATLMDHLAKALANAPQMVPISAETGTGKSWLLDELRKDAKAKHPELIIAAGICTRASRLQPYLPFITILNMLSNQVPGVVSPSSEGQSVGEKLIYAAAPSLPAARYAK